MKLTQEQYLKSGGYECPHCGERDVMATGPLDPDHMSAYQPVECMVCKKTWNDVWRLVGYCDPESQDPPQLEPTL